MSLGARYLMKDQSGLVLWFKRVRGRRGEVRQDSAVVWSSGARGAW